MFESDIGYGIVPWTQPLSQLWVQWKASLPIRLLFASVSQPGRVPVAFACPSTFASLPRSSRAPHDLRAWQEVTSFYPVHCCSTWVQAVSPAFGIRWQISNHNIRNLTIIGCYNEPVVQTDRVGSFFLFHFSEWAIKRRFFLLRYFPKTFMKPLNVANHKSLLPIATM